MGQQEIADVIMITPNFHCHQRLVSNVINFMILSLQDMRKTAKDKEKAADLERALKEMGRQETADIVMEKYQSNAEMTADCFPAA